MRPYFARSMRRVWPAALVLLAATAPVSTGAQQIPVRQGLALLYTHKNFDVHTDRQLLVEVLSSTNDESTIVARWLEPAPGIRPVEEPVSRREMAGARTISFGRQFPVDTTSRRPRTIAMASQRLMRALRQEGRVQASVPVILAPGHTIIVDGTLERVRDGLDTLELVVEGAPRKLRALHARGRFENMVQRFSATGDWWFLDDTTAAWMVRHESTNARGDTFKMVLASAESSSDEKQRDAMDEALTRSCRTTAHGFYFATNSATPEPQSAATFRDVAAVLVRHPDWTLTVEGHTDSIGNPAANQRLAERRAESIVRELVTRHGVAAARLRPAGFGDRRPTAPNTTLEGRARNRRVELVRSCDRR